MVDATNYLFRSYHAVRDLRSRDGRPTNAIYGLASSLVALGREYPGAAVACVMDAPGKTFRHKMYPEYKATRKKTDQDLLDQIEPSKEMIKALGMPLYCVAGVEADDVIATLALQGVADGMKVLVASSDKDLMYLAGKGCLIINPRDNSKIDAAGVKKKYGVPPGKMHDYLTLIGDTSDNVPGVDKVGPKTAVKWIDEYGGLDGIIENKERIKGKVGENLRASIEQIGKSAELIRLREDVEVDPPAKELMSPKPDKAAVAGICARLRFGPQMQERMLSGAPASVEDILASGPKTEVLQEKADFEAAKSFIAGNKRIGLHVETSGGNAPSMKIDATALAVADRFFFFASSDLEDCKVNDKQKQLVAEFLEWLFAQDGMEFCVFDSKSLLHALENAGIKASCTVDDVSLRAYCQDSTAHGSLQSTARRFLDEKVLERAQLFEKAKQISELKMEKVAKATGIWAKAARDLRSAIGRRMDQMALSLYREVELPVVDVLVAMEQAGILIDSAAMTRLSEEFRDRLLEIKGKIKDETGKDINLNSPTQLAGLLYDDLGFAPGKSTKGGARSTNEAELERLAASGDSEIPSLVLAYRHAAKLAGTYTDTLPKMVDENTGRLHTRFIQSGAVTGRLASVDPNLQNIPARTEDGRRIRRCFVSREGCKLVSADYSQIELRVLAHYSKDKTLLEAFEKGEDVHRRTASELYGTSQEEVSDTQRAFAKTINFGLIYGMGAYGLARRLGIGQHEARDLIDTYFGRLPEVRSYLDRVKEQASKDKFVTTLHGRRISVAPRAAGAAAHSGSMRAAINAPMQGTAADIMKLAMPAVQDGIAQKGLRSKILLQVHDELVIEAPDGEVDVLREILPPLMSKVADLEVGLEVEVGAGDNWGAAH